jgi:anion transporter
MSPLEITLVILLVTIIAFVSGKVPFSVISTGIILALILTGIKTPAEAFGGFINTNVVMFVAMFVIGAGLTKTPLIDKAQSLVIRYKDNMRMLIFLSCVADAFLGAITSATATAAIMIPLLVGIANDIGVSRSKLLYPSMACANIATQMTFLGQGASNMAWNDVMMQAGAPTPLHIWDFTIARIPMLTIAILYMTFVGYKLMPDIPNEQFSDAAHTASESEKLSPFKRKLAVLIVLASIAMMLLENVIGVKMYLTSCIGAAALVLTGVLTEREALNSIHQPTIFLFAGVLALSDAIQTTGAGDVVADWMIRLLGDTTNPYIIMLVFFLVPFILTQVMSNLATLTIFIPLVTSACIRMGVDPRAAVVGVITASCVSIMTPMAAPCQIMIIEPGGYTLKDYLKCGTPLALILIVGRVRIFPADTLSFCLILFSHRSSIRKLHIVNMPFCSALFLKTAIKAAEIFEHLIILSRGPAPSGPLSFCQSFPCVFLQAAESSVFSKVRVCAVERSNESPSGAFKRQNGLA